ncbi:MAG: PAS domain S-box protein [Candidatus Delongbacteria bacterium]|nr:PAS domain S-box protein [Candidatus Delongbacteria bacterium]
MSKLKASEYGSDEVEYNLKSNRNYFIYLTIFALEIIGIIIFGSWKYQTIFYNEVVEKSYKELLTISENISQNIRSHYNEGITQIKIFSSSPKFTGMVEKSIKLKNDEELNEFIGSYFQNYAGNIIAVSIYAPNGNIITEVSDTSRVQFSQDDMEMPKNILESKSDVFISKISMTEENEPTVDIYTKFFKNDSLLGFVKIIVNLDYLEKFVFPSSMYDYKADSFIIDVNGDIVYNDSKRAVGKNAKFISERQRGNVSGKDFAEFIDILKKGEKATGIFDYAWWLDNKWEDDKKICAFYPLRIEDKTWMIVNSYSYYEIAKPYIINSMYTYGYVGLILIAFTVLVIIIFYLMKKRIIYKTKLAFLEKLHSSTEKLDESLQKFKDLFEVNTTAICTVLPTDYISACNSMFCELTGYSEDEVIRKMKWQDIISDQDLERVVGYDSTRKKDHNAAPNEYEFDLKRKDGTFKSVLLTVRVLGTTSEQLASIIDVSSIKKVEKALRQNQYNLKKAQEIGKIGNWELDIKSNIISGSDEFFTLLNIKPDIQNQIPIKDLLMIFENPRKLLKDITGLLKYGKLFDYEYSIKSGTGKKNKIIKCIAQLVKDGKIPEKIQGVIQDITERKEIEIEITNTNNDLKNMMYVASHDLQMPLVSMEGFASILLDQYSKVLDDKGIYYLKRILANTTSMRKLINSLLSISRLNSVENPFEELNIVKLVNIVNKELELSLQDKNVELNIVDEENIPGAFGDKQRLMIVIRNLISNSINYSAKNISFGYENGKGYFVKDDGIGINKDHLERIFKPGERINDIKTEGTGMGLTFCQKVIEMHKGIIWAESEGRGEGTTIYFTIGKG